MIAEYSGLHSYVEYRDQYRPGGPNIELYIRTLNIELNTYWIAEYRALRALHSDFEYRA